MRDKHVKTFASPELAKGIFGLYLGDKVRFCPPMDVGVSWLVGSLQVHADRCPSRQSEPHHKNRLTSTYPDPPQAISPEAKAGFATLTPELVK